MELLFDQMIDDSLNLNIANVAIVPVSKAEFSTEVRKMCEMNKCGHYNTNWMCPPAVGSIDELKIKANKYKQGLLFQTIHLVNNLSDRKSIMNAFSSHYKVLIEVLDMLKNKYNLNDLLPLNAGSCFICDKCSYIDGEKCRYPDKAFPSIEAYGIDVIKLLEICNIPYNNGENTVSFVGYILFNE